ncbi:MAG: hypothetical protein ACM32H_04465, partial [Candidatus Aminicenantes bacterium RBG_16_66_30]
MDGKRSSGKIGPALLGLYLIAGATPAGTARAAKVPAPATKAVPAAGQTLLRPGPSGPIADRVAWGRAQAKANGWDKGFWLGFGIRRLMGEHSSMGWYPWGGAGTRLSLDDLINGRKTPLEKKIAGDQAARGTAASMPGEARAFAAAHRSDEPERPVMKELGILVRLTPRPEDFP